MNKQIIIPIALILLVGLSVFVYAYTTSGEIISYPENNNNLWDFQYTMDLEKGWNLIAYGEDFPFHLDAGSDLKKEIDDFMSIPGFERKNRLNEAPLFTYILNPKTKDYIRIFPDSEIQEQITRVNYAVWVYVKKGTRISYFAPNAPKLNDIKLLTGWNLIAINPIMGEKTLNNIKGSCDISKAYFYNYEPEETERGTNWKNIPLDFILPDEIIGGGMAIKVSGNCALGSQEEITTPPALPS
ncbi:hypothetical protein GOV06_02975 [Candidatus Woesearchaeota archaeon]|nr:hypothetical protein [Candidatus Woesearchaeota archaeon]